MPTTVSEHDREIWTGMLRYLRASHPTICRQWFEEIEPAGVDGGTLLLRVHSPVHRDYLQRQCVPPFREAAQSVTGHLLALRFVGEDEEPVRGPAPAPVPDTVEAVEPASWPEGDRAPEWAYADSLPLNPDYAFDHFVVGPGNRLAHAAAQAVSVSPGRAYNPYFVHGDVGLGKTHLLQAICLRILAERPRTRIYYTSAEGFITQFTESVRTQRMSRFRHKFRDVDVLVIDDIHFLSKKESSQEEFFHTFNALFQAHKQIVLSSDAPPEDIPDLEDRLVSRFKWGLVTSVDKPGYETRVQILKNKARLRSLELPDDVAGYVASKLDTNIRELEGAIVKLQIMASVENRPVTLDLARTALGDDARAERQIQIQTIIEVTTGFYGVKVTDLQSKRRHRSVALPRQVCMALARKLTRHSLEEIGGYFGGRDHTTVLHALKTVADRSEADNDFARIMTTLEQRIRDATA
jgi:chromosomal replication initiator protein